MVRNILIAFAVLLVGCGKESPIERFNSPDLFPPASSMDTIPARWVSVVRFGVAGRSSYDAFVEVAVKGVQGAGATTRCELITSHRRFRVDRAWSPLPMAFYSVKISDPNGVEDLNDLFKLTLDFSDKSYDSVSLLSRVTFTRGKVFDGRWHIFSKLVTEDGAERCSAFAAIERSAQTHCRFEKCAVKEVIAEVDAWRYLTQKSKPEKEKDDLSALTLTLQDLGADDLPVGGIYHGRVPDFK